MWRSSVPTCTTSKALPKPNKQVGEMWATDELSDRKDHGKAPMKISHPRAKCGTTSSRSGNVDGPERPRRDILHGAASQAGPSEAHAAAKPTPSQFKQRRIKTSSVPQPRAKAALPEVGEEVRL